MTAALTAAGVQYGTVTIAGGATTGTATINEVGAGAVLLLLGQTTTLGTANPARGVARITLTDPTTITATRNTLDATATITVSFAVIDGDTTNLIESAQYGSINFGAVVSGNATITSAAVANTAVHSLGWTTTATTTTPTTQWPTVHQTSPTNIKAMLGTAPGANTATTNFVAITFKPTALQSLQFITDTSSPTGTTRISPITSASMANTLLIWGGQRTAGGANYSGGDQYAQLTSPTQITIGTNAAANVSVTYNCYAVELATDLVETSAQRGNIAIVSAMNGTATLSPGITAADAVLNFTGNQTNGTLFSTRNSRLTLASTTVVSADTNSNATTKTGWELLALNPAGGAPPPSANSRISDFMAYF